MITKDIITKVILISLPAIAGGSLLIAGYFYKPEPVNLDRDEFLNAMKSTRVWTEKDTQQLLNKLEEFNKDLCKTYEILYTMVPTSEAIEQAKTVDQIPQLVLYRQLVSELEKKEWNILPIVIAVDTAYTYPLFVEVPDPTNTVSMKIRSVYSEPWLSDLLWNMRVYTQILPKCEKYYSDETVKAFKISAEPPPEHKPDNNNNQNNQQQNTNTSNNNNNNINTNNNSNNNNSNVSSSNNTNNANNTNVAKQTIKNNKDNFDEEFKKRQEEFEKEKKEFERKFNEQWKSFEEEFNKQQQHH